MINFIPAIRNDRRREISEYELKGYSFSNKNVYLYLQNIVVYVNDVRYEFQVRVDSHDVKFHTIKNNANIYLNIYELYKLYVDMSKIKGENYIISILKSYLYDDYSVIFKYRLLDYDLRFPRDNIDTGTLNIDKSNLSIDFHELFILTCLIQAKSNYFFSLTKSDNEYSNGIIRMLIVLLSLQNDHKIISDIGWNFNYEEKLFKFELGDMYNKSTRESKKYYLTENEMKRILKVES